MELKFSTRNEKQLTAAEYWLDSETEEILYGGAKGGGKSFLGASLIFGDALLYPDTHYFIARKELIDLRKFTIPTVHEVFKKWGLDVDKYAKFNGQDNVFNLHNDSKVYLISCSDVPSDPLFERFGSMQMTRGWIEEAGEVAEAAKANLALSIGRRNNDTYSLKRKLLLTANPKKGWLKRDFVEPFRQGLLPNNRKYIQAFATDNTYLPEDYVNALRNEKDTVRRQRLFEGSWDYDEDQDSLLAADALEDAFSNTITKEGGKFLIVDVARLGRDSTIFALWDGLELIKIDQYFKQTTDVTEQKIKDLAASERIPYSNILIDEDGIGGGVVDHLRGVKGFTANSTPMPTATEIRDRTIKLESYLIPKRDFANLKAQCGWKLAELLNDHKIALRVPEYRDQILEEVTAILRQKNVDGDGKKTLRAKDVVKLELGRSPDIADTMLMRVWFELKRIAGDDNPERAIALSKQVDRMNTNIMRSKSNSTR